MDSEITRPGLYFQPSVVKRGRKAVSTLLVGQRSLWGWFRRLGRLGRGARSPCPLGSRGSLSNKTNRIVSRHAKGSQLRGLSPCWSSHKSKFPFLALHPTPFTTPPVGFFPSDSFVGRESRWAGCWVPKPRDTHMHSHDVKCRELPNTAGRPCPSAVVLLSNHWLVSPNGG